MTRRSGPKIIVFSLVLVGLVVALFGIVARVRARGVLKRETRASAPPNVTVFVPKFGASAEELLLPGAIQAFTDAPIYARTDGYLKKWFADIGRRVKKDELLAVIESPEVDQQLLQARADLGMAQANARLAEITANRYIELQKTDSVARQDVDNAIGEKEAREAAVHSAVANVKRLESLVSFEKIYAPFDGVITARNTDIGQLIDSGASGGTARELYHIAEIRTLRVFIDVPEADSRAASPGLAAELTLSEYPGRRFSGKLVRTSDSIDPAARTLRAEIDIDNARGELLPGAYAQVHLRLASRNPTLILPGSALMFRSEGLRVATLSGGDRVRLVPVTLGRDFGKTVEVTSGLSGGERVIDSPPDSLVDGEQVRPARTP